MKESGSQKPKAQSHADIMLNEVDPLQECEAKIHLPLRLQRLRMMLVFVAKFDMTRLGILRPPVDEWFARLPYCEGMRLCCCDLSAHHL